LVCSFLISYIRARAEGLGIECKTGLFTRAERVIILAFGLMVNQVLIALIVLAVFTFFTVIQRIVHVWRQTRH
jgi:CDP-diacylglycerol--glycerol-3-phosphate 3-phosphatidyltransferase